MLSGYSVGFDEALSAGKHYQLKFGNSTGSTDEPYKYVWWQEVTPQ